MSGASGAYSRKPSPEIAPKGGRRRENLAKPFLTNALFWRQEAHPQAGLDAGRLRFMVSSLHTNDGQTGAPSYPDFATRFNAVVVEPTQIELDVLVVGAGDLDADGLADDWELHQLKSLTFGPSDDPDEDSATNFTEHRAGTDPLDGQDLLRLLYAITSPTAGLTLSWPHQASRSYMVETMEDWQTWQPVTAAALLYPEPGLVEWTDPSTLTNAPNLNRVYRVNVKQR